MPTAAHNLLIRGPVNIIGAWLAGLGWHPPGAMPAEGETWIAPTQALNLLFRTVDGTTYIHLRTEAPVVMPDGAQVVGAETSAAILGAFAGDVVAPMPVIEG